MAGSELPHIFLLLNASSTTLAITEGTPFLIVGGVALALSSLAAMGQVAVIVLASRGRTAISDSLAAAYGNVDLSRSPGWRHWLRATLAPHASVGTAWNGLLILNARCRSRSRRVLQEGHSGLGEAGVDQSGPVLDLLQTVFHGCGEVIDRCRGKVADPALDL